jgi:hypothetical protein
LNDTTLAPLVEALEKLMRAFEVVVDPELEAA